MTIVPHFSLIHPYLNLFMHYIIMALNHFFFPASLLLLSLVVIAFASGDGYSTSHDLVKPNVEKEDLLSTIIGIQGLVYCKSGPKLIPLEGNS